MTAVLPSRSPRRSAPQFDVQRIRDDFPIFRQTMHGQPLVYLDSASTTQKPQTVLDAEAHYYTETCANIHRGVYLLSEQATQEFEETRAKAQRFINARESKEIVFTRGTTEGINLVAHSFGRRRIKEGDEIIISYMEHHSNIVPWQLLCEEVGAKLRVVPINDAGEFQFDDFEKLLNPRTKMVAIVHISNVLGSILPVRKVIEAAHRQNVPVLIDGAQAVANVKVDVQALDCDFYVFSSHKLYGPTGVGVLYGKATHLEAMPPYQGGGDMIRSVTFEKTTYNAIPYKFEAGTPNIAGVIGLGAAIDYFQGLGLEAVFAHEEEVLDYATQELQRIPGLRLIGTAREKVGVLSFMIEGIHPHDIGTILDQHGVAIRTGHHCAQPVMDRYGVPATARASIGVYNTKEDIDTLASALIRVKEVFR